ncbi:expressed unknown protein [Seminavis robusta]|uniref:Uncharacterized protein n=1 Tax=Seminavis robusta TaxID=568900 RepID=A0A9N8DFX9_9STRA|nr:expressed unknown protein [Seminavis robusta]|eukprot:Sro69_g038650.1 n/a (321) ;mRNA; f:101411-102373
MTENCTKRHSRQVIATTQCRRQRSRPLLLLLGFLLVVTALLLQASAAKAPSETKKPWQRQSVPIDQEFEDSPAQHRLEGLLALLSARPMLLFSAVVRIGIALGLELAMDAVLKTVVTPLLVASGIGALLAPATFLLEYAFQPLIHSIAFLVFDDNFVMATLETTGIQDRLVRKDHKNNPGVLEWHKMSFFEGFCTRYVVKSLTAWCLGWAGLCTIVPVVGHLLTAVLTGWLVAWDYVYVPLSGLGYIGPLQQFQTVWQHFSYFQWYGFWAVLIEEIPVLGPACHVYNVYSAAYFLEGLYSWRGVMDEDAATVATDFSQEL